MRTQEIYVIPFSTYSKGHHFYDPFSTVISMKSLKCKLEIATSLFNKNAVPNADISWRRTTYIKAILICNFVGLFWRKAVWCKALFLLKTRRISDTTLCQIWSNVWKPTYGPIRIYAKCLPDWIHKFLLRERPRNGIKLKSYTYQNFYFVIIFYFTKHRRKAKKKSCSLHEGT